MFSCNSSSIVNVCVGHSPLQKIKINRYAVYDNSNAKLAATWNVLYPFDIAIPSKNSQNLF